MSQPLDQRQDLAAIQGLTLHRYIKIKRHRYDSTVITLSCHPLDQPKPKVPLHCTGPWVTFTQFGDEAQAMARLAEKLHPQPGEKTA